MSTTPSRLRDGSSLVRDFIELTAASRIAIYASLKAALADFLQGNIGVGSGDFSALRISGGSAPARRPEDAPLIRLHPECSLTALPAEGGLNEMFLHGLMPKVVGCRTIQFNSIRSTALPAGSLSENNSHGIVLISE